MIYLARPCQYGMRSNPHCQSRLWSAARFGEVVVDATDRNIDELLARFEDRIRLILLGYSGGGVIAALVAARRDGVDLLVTMAAPLDVADWTRLARVSRLSESLSPMDEITALRRLPQHHFVAGEDVVVPLPSRIRSTYSVSACSRAEGYVTGAQTPRVPDWNTLESGSAGRDQRAAASAAVVGYAERFYFLRVG